METKSIKQIIAHVKNSPLYAKFRARESFIKILPKNWQKIIAFIYTKNDILMIAVKHPAGLQELKRDSSIKLIKDILKIFASVHKFGEFHADMDVKIFVATKTMSKKRKQELAQKKASSSDVRVAEKSQGKFANNIKDEKIHKIFEEIREIIIANRRNQIPAR